VPRASARGTRVARAPPMLRPRVLLFFAFAATCSLAVPRLASAQTVTMPQGTYPSRDQPFRPQNLKPQGVNYQDCAQDVTLRFPLIVSGFDGQNLSIWASLGSDCTSPADRGVGGVAGQACWRLDGGFVGQTYHVSTPVDVAVRVQDALAHMDGTVRSPRRRPTATSGRAPTRPVPRGGGSRSISSRSTPPTSLPSGRRISTAWTSTSSGRLRPSDWRRPSVTRSST